MQIINMQNEYHKLSYYGTYQNCIAICTVYVTLLIVLQQYIASFPLQDVPEILVFCLVFLLFYCAHHNILYCYCFEKRNSM